MNSKDKVEMIDYRPFKNPTDGGTVGMAFLRVSHGLTENYFTHRVQRFQLDQNGDPQISNLSQTEGISYDIDSEIYVALEALREAGWISKKAEITFTSGKPGQHNILLSNWEPEEPHDSHLAYHMDDCAGSLEAAHKAFSKEWYYAKIVFLYFFECPISVNSALTIGVLLAQLWWKTLHEKNAMQGQKNLNALAAAELAKPKMAANRKCAKLECVARLWREAKSELGIQAMRKDTNAAHAIYARAVKEKPSELMVKKTGEVIKSDAIRRLLPELRNSGKID